MTLAFDDYQKLSVAIDDDGLALLRLCRPEHLNAIDETLHLELSEAFWEIGSASAVNAVVIVGEGDAFSAGGDHELLSRLHDDPPLRRRMTLEGRRIVEGLLALEVPVVAAVNGPAVGLGATLALFCDIVVMARSASIGDPHVLVGLAAGDGGALAWSEVLGRHRAMQYLLTGELVKGEEAEQMGLVNFVVEKEDVLNTAMGFARRVASGSRVAVRATKAAVNAELRARASRALAHSFALEELSMTHDDGLEGARAAGERRKPTWPSHHER